MDFLNRAFDQVKDLFASMTPGARITSGLLLVVVVVSLVYLFQNSTAAPEDFLLGGRAFSSAELEAMEGAFAQAGLSNYKIESNRVRIPSGNKAAYIAALAEGQALPANFSDYFTTQANNASIFESKQQAAQRWRLARQQELALIVSLMNGISRAQVIYDEVEKGGFPRRTEKTATVAVQAEGNEPLESHQVKAIRSLVSSAIGGMKYQNVAVTDLNTGRNFGGGDADMASAEDDAYMDRKRTYEHQWEDKLRKALSFVKGAVVSVDVELTKETFLREDNVTIDAKPVAVNSTTFEKSVTTASARPSGRPGINGQANQQASINTSGSESTSEESREDQQSVPSHGRIVKSTAPLVPRKVTAAIGVPSSYYLEIWRERNPTPAGEEAKPPGAQDLQLIESEVKKKIEDMVVNLIPKLPAGEDKYPLVAVKTFEHLSQPPLASPSLTQTASAWLAENWSMLGMMLVGAAGLLMLRGMLRTPPAAESPQQQLNPPLSVVGSDEDREDGDEEGSSRRRFASDGPNIKDELAGMVRENPEAAANILRNWIADAA